MMEQLKLVMKIAYHAVKETGFGTNDHNQIANRNS